VDLTLTGSFDWLGKRQEVAVGGDFTEVQVTVADDFYFDIGSVLSDLHTFDPAAYPDPRGAISPDLHLDGEGTLQQGGVFVSWRTYLNDDWSVVGGARIGSDRIRTQVSVSMGPLSASDSFKFGSSRVVTPYAGVMVDLDEHYSVYVSYAGIYLTQEETQRADGSALPTDVTGVDIEAGIKGAWRNGALNGALVVYRADQRDVAVPGRGPRLAGDLLCCYRSGTSRSKGVDLELAGEITRGWLIGAGYTFNYNEAAWGGTLSRATPRHQLKLWTSKQLPGAFDRWTVGGSLQAQSSTSSSGTLCAQPLVGSLCFGDFVPVEATQDAYAVVDVRLGFQIDPNWQAALTVGNVFDEIYYQTLGESLVSNWYGEPRSYSLRIEGRY
jgi:outer membrane receptor for ferric coprogen and ferric-rhodotorulic acid